MTTVNFVIHGEPASKANSRQLVTIRGRPAFIKSKKARDYVKLFDQQCQTLPELLEGDLAVVIKIYYASRRPDLDESVILDCMQGDSTLYARGDSVENSWKFIDPILKAWKDDPDIPIYGYPAGTWGPEHINELIEGKDMAWRNASSNLSHDGEYCEL